MQPFIGLLLKSQFLLNRLCNVLGVMKMGNIVPRVRSEPSYLAFWASVLPLYHIGSLMSALYPYLPVYAEVSADYYSNLRKLRPGQI